MLEHIGHHPFVVDYKGAYRTRESVEFVLEYMPGGELFDRLIERGPYTEQDARLPFKRLAEALAYLHGRGIVHRDLKVSTGVWSSVASAAPGAYCLPPAASPPPRALPMQPENILLADTSSKPVLKIADFGLSQLIGANERLLKVCG